MGRRWKLGPYELLTPDYEISMDEMDFYERVVHLPAASAEIRRWLRNAAYRSVLVRVYQSLQPGRHADLSRLDEDVAQTISGALRTKRLLLFREKSRTSMADLDGRPEEAQVRQAGAAERETDEKTWFRAQLLDEDGQPMVNEDYVLVDSNGTRRTGKLDQDGTVSIPKILVPGNCTISFPNVHLNPRKRR